ncbi:GTPase-activating protein [Spodoptera litura]|uniref:GTPase-activating protein n=1 Tax=Spodoptera litura TaxID=69820 RepID=A0A9J7IUI0_SPOLT|nr:GTPase-activating protein [Spodoptera litura]
MKEINSYGFNMADDMRKVRVEERLKIKIGEAKNLPGRSHGAACHRDIYCVLSLDQEEIFRTSTMERTLNPFFGEEFQFEVPRRFRYLSIYVFDRDKHLKQDKVLGKVAIKREDLHRYNNKDHWFALRPVDADSEVQGKAYIELTLEDSRKRLRMEPKPPDPDPTVDNCSTKAKGNNLIRLSEYCKESMRFGSCSSSTSKKLLSAVATEPSLSLSRSESLKDRAQWAARTKPPMHAMPESDASPTPTAADYWSDPERHCAARVGHDTLRLRVLECSELTTKNGQCDPFALVTLLYSNGRRVEKRTKPKKKTVNPQFDEIFCFDLVMDADPKDKDGSQTAGVACEARVSVWHDAATPIFLGEVRLQLRQPSPTPLRAWFFLTSRAGGALSRGATPPGTRLSAAGSATLGSLRLLLQYTVDHVFPLQHYRTLEELFLRSVHQKPITASAVYILGEIVSSKTDAAQPLVRLFTHHDLIVPIVKELADAEISALTDATTIFRGNTLVSKMMDEAMRLSGASYLRAVLRPTLAAVLAERRPCEIDPARVKPSAAVTANLANLKDYVERVFAAITSSYAMCPSAMCRLFDALRQCAARHFPRNAEVRYSVVSGFIFLRFFAPAILGPRLFDLTTEQIDPQTNRTLTLISKTIQSLGNLVSSRSAQQVCKEEYMAELYRSFCTPRHVQAIKQFLEIISTSTDTQNNNIQETPVLLKEGTMIKRSEGVRTGAGSPRRRWTRAAHAYAKRRHFRLTSGELSWSRTGARATAQRLPLSGVLAVAAVDCPTAGAPLGANNIFQIVHRERVLFVQAANCVERAEWVRLLSALCRHERAAAPHRGYYADCHWTCCGRPDAAAEGCAGPDPELTASGAREAVPPRGHTSRARPPPRPAEPDTASRAADLHSLPSDDCCRTDAVSTDDSLLDELQRDAYCVLKVCEDEPPTPETPMESTPTEEKRDAGPFSRVCAQRKSNPIKSQATSTRPLKTSSSTSNVHDAGSTSSRPLAERLTPFFLKRKSKPPEETQTAPRPTRKEENLIGRLTPRFGQSRLYGRGQSLELAPPDGRTKRIERSATTVNIPTRPINSSIVANLKFLSLHRYGAQEDVQCRAFGRTEPEPATEAGGAGAAAPAAPADAHDAAWRRTSLLAAASNDIRL